MVGCRQDTDWWGEHNFILSLCVVFFRLCHVERRRQGEKRKKVDGPAAGQTECVVLAVSRRHTMIFYICIVISHHRRGCILYSALLWPYSD